MVFCVGMTELMGQLRKRDKELFLGCDDLIWMTIHIFLDDNAT